MCLGWMVPAALAVAAVGLTIYRNVSWKHVLQCARGELTPSLGECLRVLCSELCTDGLAPSDVPDEVQNSIRSAPHVLPDPSEVDPWRKCRNEFLSRAAHSYHDTESSGNPRYLHLESWEESYRGSQGSFVPSSQKSL